MSNLSLISNWFCIEGFDGAGKSTAVLNLKEFLAKDGRRVTQTREPGGTPWSEILRDALKYPPQEDKPGLKAQLAAMFASRYNLYDKVIEPHLNDGNILLCDRFAGSTYAYQVAPNPQLKPLFDAMFEAGAFAPRFDIFLDVSYENSQKRMGVRGEEMDAIEQQNAGEDKFNRLREGMLEYLNTYQAERHIIVDTNDKTEDEVWQEVYRRIVCQSVESAA